ncbi:MAG: hypothetical protein A3F17_07850 [Gammaproteobacteria bacterium RIFCSPHIGHO2_12_FULL_41_15]|nr:MAG: hypothetical protein A3F17_07850 [Gammaproteobacteria bacterium RIFCSPHIGHO2_12_FULL_41_15]
MSIFNPFEKNYFAVTRFKKLTFIQQLLITLGTFFAGIFSLGLASVGVFRFLVGLAKACVVSPKTSTELTYELSNSINKENIDMEIVTELLRRLEFKDKTDLALSSLRSELRNAIYDNKVELVRALLENKDLCEEVKMYYLDNDLCVSTVLYCAQTHEMVDLLLEKGADPNAYRSRATDECIKEFEKVIVDPNYKMPPGCAEYTTPLIYFRDNPAIARILIDYNADVHAKNSEGRTALMQLEQDKNEEHTPLSRRPIRDKQYQEYMLNFFRYEEKVTRVRTCKNEQSTSPTTLSSSR